MRQTIDNRQSNTNAERCHETCAACLGSCVLQGVADTTTTKFFIPKKIQTTRDDDPRIIIRFFSTAALTLPVQPIMILIQLFHRIASSSAATKDAHMLLRPKQDCTRYMAEPVQGHFTTDSINGISHIIQLARSSLRVLTSACVFSTLESWSAFHVLSGHNTLCSSVWKQNVVQCPPFCLFSRGGATS